MLPSESRPVLLMVMMMGAKVILQDHAANSLACTRQPGLASCGNPSGSENAPVGSVDNPIGVEMGVAPKSEPLGPVTCGCLSMSALLSQSIASQAYGSSSGLWSFLSPPPLCFFAAKVPIAAPSATAKTSNNTRTKTTTPMGIFPHNLFLRQLVLAHSGSPFSLYFSQNSPDSDAKSDAEDDSDGAAGTVLLEKVGARVPVCVSGLCGGSRAGVTVGSKGSAAAAAGRAGGEKDASLRGDTGDTGALKGSSGSMAGFKGAGMIRDALASAAMEALVGPSSGYLEYGGSCSVWPSGPMMSCSSPSGPRTRW